MPPAKELTVKLKSDRTTVVLLVPGSITVPKLIDQLATALNESRVLDHADADEDADIDIPKPSFETDEPESGANDTARSSISSEDIYIALPEEKTVLADNKWADITKSKGSLESLGARENGTLAFAIGSPEFDVDFPVDE